MQRILIVIKLNNEYINYIFNIIKYVLYIFYKKYLRKQLYLIENYYFSATFRFRVGCKWVVLHWYLFSFLLVTLFIFSFIKIIISVIKLKNIYLWFISGNYELCVIISVFLFVFQTNLFSSNYLLHALILFNNIVDYSLINM